MSVSHAETEADKLESPQETLEAPSSRQCSPRCPLSASKGGMDSTRGRAERQRVVWVRVKGYPPWPAQVMDEGATKKWLKNVRPGKYKTLPVMFFGTFEICWSSASSVLPWDTGVEQGYLAKSSKDRRLPASIEQARLAASSSSARSKPHSKGIGGFTDSFSKPLLLQAVKFLDGQVDPRWWWQPPKAAKKDLSAANKDSNRQKSPPKPATAQPLQGPAPKRRRVETEASEPAPASQSAFSLEQIKLPVPHASAPAGVPLLSEEQQDLFASKRRVSAPVSICGRQALLEVSGDEAPPKYEFAKRNVWSSQLSRPKRLPRDDIPACDCCPSLSQPGPLETAETAAPTASTAHQLERSTRARTVRVQELGKVDCGPDCVNRQSFVHCDVKTCPCGTQCTNRPFYLLPLPKLAVFHTGNRGWGVRACEHIPSGSFIVEYTGELLNLAEKQRRLEEQARSGICDFYMMEYSPGVIIDARLKGNLARLINSSCNPNCETQKWRDAATNERRIGIFAKRDILPGEELAYDYNFEHSGLAHQAGAYRCQCGAANCRGTMDSRPDRLKDAFRRIDIFWDGDQKFFRGTVTSFHAASSMHLVRYDDGQRSRENLLVTRHKWLPDDAPFLPGGHDGELQPGQLLSNAADTSKATQTSPAQPAPALVKHEEDLANSAVPGRDGARLADLLKHIGFAGKAVTAAKPEECKHGQSVLLSLLQDAACANKSAGPTVFAQRGPKSAQERQENLVHGTATLQLDSRQASVGSGPARAEGSRLDQVALCSRALKLDARSHDDVVGIVDPSRGRSSLQSQAGNAGGEALQLMGSRLQEGCQAVDLGVQSTSTAAAVASEPAFEMLSSASLGRADSSVQLVLKRTGSDARPFEVWLH